MGLPAATDGGHAPSPTHRRAYGLTPARCGNSRRPRYGVTAPVGARAPQPHSLPVRHGSPTRDLRMNDTERLPFKDIAKKKNP